MAVKGKVQRRWHPQNRCIAWGGCATREVPGGWQFHNDVVAPGRQDTRRPPDTAPARQREQSRGDAARGGDNSQSPDRRVSETARATLSDGCRNGSGGLTTIEASDGSLNTSGNGKLLTNARVARIQRASKHMEGPLESRLVYAAVQ